MEINLWDLVIKNGLIVDGSGTDPYPSDVAIENGMIAAIGKNLGRGVKELDASGFLVTPGFVDIHTHYDGQVTWENRTAPSCFHGVTTVVLGNCGVGFAPCRKKDRGALVALMEGVEDIPEIVMTTGLPWNWETFREYLNAIEAREYDADIATQLPHSALRVYVMGQRAIDNEAANPDDLVQMKALAKDAIQAGALGFATSRSIFHKDVAGRSIPTQTAAEEELQAIASGMSEAGDGVIEVLFDFDRVDDQLALFRKIGERSGRPITFTLVQTVMSPHGWKRALSLIEDAHRDGVSLRGQIIGRPTGVLFGFELSWCPFSLRPTYDALSILSWPEKLKALKNPAIRAKILSEKASDTKAPLLQFMRSYDWIFALGDPPNYEPSTELSISKIAERECKSTDEVAYELMMEHDGKGVLFAAVANYVDGSLDAVLTMMKHPLTLLGLGDGGAHYGIICDAGYPTFMLVYWTRDRVVGERLSLSSVIRKLSHDTAAAVGLNDRGLIAVGYKADINVIDYEKLRLHSPKITYDLPAGGKRLSQAATGYVATIVNGIVTYENGSSTGATPGRLVRGSKVRPISKESLDAKRAIASA